ncbi:MAG TPA: acylglycerol kinase family protein, partial [Chloroflexota bacterium]
MKGSAVTAAVFVVVNPAAGSGRGRALWPRVANRLRALGIDYEFEGTQGPLSAESFTRQALRQGVDTVVAVGGDGTFNEVVNGFFSDGAPTRAGASLLMVPAGSSSDIARGLGLSMGTAALDVLRHGQTKEIDLGRADYLFQARPMQRY